MSTANNVINLEQSQIVRVRTAIEDVLSNRGGKWVGEFVIINAAQRVAPPNVDVFGIIKDMVADNILEQSFQVVNDKFHRPVQLPLYRLAPNYNW